MENERLFRPVEAARQGEFDFGADLSKKRKAFLEKKAALIGPGPSLCSQYVKITSRTIAVERHSARKLNSSALALLQIFDLSFAGSWVATCFCDVTYRFFYLSVTMSPPSRKFCQTCLRPDQFNFLLVGSLPLA